MVNFNSYGQNPSPKNPNNSLVIDLSGVMDRDDTKTLQPGAYVGTIVSAERDFAASTGNERINLAIEVDGEGVMSYANVTWHSPASQQFLKRLVTATDTMPADGQLDVYALADQLVGKKLTIQVSPELYNNRVQHQVRNYWPIDQLQQARAALRQQQNIINQGSSRTAGQARSTRNTPYGGASASPNDFANSKAVSAASKRSDDDPMAGL